MKRDKFKVKLHGRAGLTYIEGSKRVEIDSELFFDPIGVVIYSDSFNSWINTDSQNITILDKDDILNKLKCYFEKLNYKVIIDKYKNVE